MRIAHACTSIDPRSGGPSNVLIRLAQGLSSRGHDVVVVTADAPGAVEEERASLASVGVELLAGGPQKGALARGPRTATLLREAITPATDVVHVHALWQHAPHLACRVARARGVPYVLRPCGMLDPWSLAQNAAQKKLCLKLIAKTDLERAARVHFTAPLEHDLIAPLGLDVSGVVIPNGIDREEFDPAPTPGLLREEHGLGERSIVVFLSRLHHKKGLDILIDAFARGAPDDAALVIVGDGDASYVESLRERARERGVEGRTLFTGLLRGRDRLRALVDADLFCLPSHQENFGVAVVEASACALPVLISDKVNIYPMIEEAGVGRIEPLESERFARAMGEMLADRDTLRTVGAKARAWALETYDWSNLVERVETMYENVRRR